MIELFWMMVTIILISFGLMLLTKWVDFKYDILTYNTAIYALIEDFLMRNKNVTEIYNNKDKIAVVTGGNRGIGKEVVKMLLQTEMTVIMGCRNTEAGAKLVDEFKNEGITKGKLHVYPLDTSSIKSVKNFVEMVKSFFKINILINNAGIMYVPSYKETKEGFELQFATNYLGHFLLTHSLLPLIKNGATDGENARIINVSSCVHEFGEINFEDINNKHTYSMYKAYSQSKLAQILFTNHLNKILKKDGLNIQTHSVHPGVVNTDIFGGDRINTYFWWLFPYLLKSPTQGAMTIVFAAISKKLEGKGGTYLSNCTIKSQKTYCDENIEKNFFELSKVLLGIQEFGKA